MAFFKRKLGPVELFERALKEKQTARQKLFERTRAAEEVLEERRAAAERLAVAGASNAQLDRAEAGMRAVEEKARKLRAELAELDEQILSTDRALADARVQRDRDKAADDIEALAAAIEQAIPRFELGATGLVDGVGKGPASVPEAARFALSVDEMRREVLSAADLICWELRSTAVRTRAGNANVALLAPPEPKQLPAPEIERHMIYTLNPLRWIEGSEVRRVPAFTMVGLPKALLPVALRHQHVDYLNARRVQTLMHVHGSGRLLNGDLPEDDPQLVDLDALLVEQEKPSAEANVA
jgi:hypothetical protein